MSGHKIAQYHLGCCYLDGDGIDKDINSAIEWFKKSAEQGFGKAQTILGRIFLLGEEIDSDLDFAIHYIRLGVKSNNPEAKYYLAMCYEEGLGMEVNWEAAIHFYKEASDEGIRAANSRLIPLLEQYIEDLQDDEKFDGDTHS